ncbi:hypothetical protein SNEBB_008504, partial [Seison nebaliae]
MFWNISCGILFDLRCFNIPHQFIPKGRW